VTFNTQLAHVSRLWDFDSSTSFVCCCFLCYMCCSVLFLYICVVFVLYLFSCAGFIIGTCLFSQHVNQNLIYYCCYYYYSYPLSPLCKVVTNKQLKEIMFLGNIVWQLFCSYNSWHRYCYFRCYIFFTFTLVISDVYV
jgi:hypothetical protein